MSFAKSLASLVNFALTMTGTMVKGNGSPSFTPVLPPSYPLAVRNPYLSAWLPGSEAANLPSAIPEFWTGQKLGWSVLARVEESNKWTTYSLFGFGGVDASITSAQVVSGEYTSTRTIFVVTAGKATFTLEFFSPVSPKDFVRQSLPFSYLTVTASSQDGLPIQIYSAIDSSWTGHFEQNAQINVTQSISGSTSVYEWIPVNPTIFKEVNDMAQWGRIIFASRKTETSTNFTYATGPRDTVRAQFVNGGTLSNPQAAFQSDTITAFAHDLGSVNTTTNVTFAIGHYHEDAINYRGNDRTPYFRSEYRDPISAVVHFLDDYTSAYSDCRSFESKLHDLAISAGGEKYRDILALTVRQVFGAIEITILSDTNPTNTKDVMAFIKELSSNGDINTIDIIFPAAPLFYVLAPEYIRLLLEPLVQYLNTGVVKQAFPLHDLGTYPNAIGHDNGDTEPMPVEASGDLLILAYMYEKATGSALWAGPAGTYTPLLRKYADYLSVESNGLHIPSQLSTIDGPGPLAGQTNLAIKAAVALNAFGVMSQQSSYSERGLNYSSQLYNGGKGGLGLSCDSGLTHFTLQTMDVHNCSDFAFSTAWNLYPDVLLGLGTFPTSAVAMQDAFYVSARKEQGVQADTRGDWESTFWGFWAAATADASSKSRQMYIDDIYAYMANGRNDHPFCDRFHVTGTDVGLEYTWRARPVIGGHFAVLARQGADLFK